MAETWCKAFGRYLRTLRQRRGLSLQEVCSLSQAFAERLEKGYLSRCENGYQGPAFSKIIPLSRIYDVPADVLLERLELDMELDRVGSPPTDGMTFAELTRAARETFNQGFAWHAYAFARDALVPAAEEPVGVLYRDATEQRACAVMHCATVALHLGRKRFALHELKLIENSGDVGPGFFPVLLERLSVTYRRLQQLDLARHYGDKAIREAEGSGAIRWLGYAYSNRAHLALTEHDLESAAALYQRAHRAFQAAGREHERSRTLNNLAQVYFDLGRMSAARRTLVVAGRVAESFGQHRARALGRILMGEIDALEQKCDLAAQRWKEASDIARRLNDKVLRFKAEYLLFKQAFEKGNQPVARSLGRRLKKLSNWIPQDTPELASFQQLQSGPRSALPS